MSGLVGKGEQQEGGYFVKCQSLAEKTSKSPCLEIDWILARQESKPRIRLES